MANGLIFHSESFVRKRLRHCSIFVGATSSAGASSAKVTHSSFFSVCSIQKNSQNPTNPSEIACNMSRIIFAIHVNSTSLSGIISGISPSPFPPASLSACSIFP